MNRNLTQPEEIDLVLLAMESNDSGMVMPMQEDVKTGLPDGEMHADHLEQCRPDPLPYVWSM